MNHIKVSKLDIHFKAVWLNSKASQAAIQFWQRLNALPEGTDAVKRSTEAVYLALYGDKVIGVTTAFPIKVQRLNNNFFYSFRVLIDPEFRTPGLVDKLCVLTKELLSQNRNCYGNECIGMITLVQNQYLKKFRNEVIWPSSGFTYIGDTKAGHHIRILYFDRAYI